MAGKTRSITQYQTLTLVNITRQSKNNANDDIARRELVAIFDDISKLNAFVKGTEEIAEHDVIEDWTELKPKQENFSLPFNPKAGELVITIARSRGRGA